MIFYFNLSKSNYVMDIFEIAIFSLTEVMLINLFYMSSTVIEATSLRLRFEFSLNSYSFAIIV